MVETTDEQAFSMCSGREDRMPNLFREWKSDIEQYCSNNGLSFQKAEKMVKGNTVSVLTLQYYDENDAHLRLMDETPMPVVLRVYKERDGLRFEQTEFTSRYLGI